MLDQPFCRRYLERNDKVLCGGGGDTYLYVREDMSTRRLVLAECVKGRDAYAITNILIQDQYAYVQTISSLVKEKK